MIKRDDLTGLALGGNKCRKLEFVLADAKQKGVDTIITSGSSQSNFAVQMAAAARKLGMEPYLVLVRSAYVEKQGNLLLHDILGSRVSIIDASAASDMFGDVIAAKMNALADELRKQGHRPLVVPPGATMPLGATGWVNAADEIWNQLQAQNIEAQYLVVATGGGSTQGGLITGIKCLGLPLSVIGFSFLHRKAKAISEVVTIANETSKFLGLDLDIAMDEVTIYDDYIGEGYGIITDACIEAIRLVAQTEGILLDPVCTGKAMSGLVDLVRRGYFKSTDTIVFIHTGGIPTLFAYAEEIVR
jgi:D-cysteine desulfhydrase family pyridoxal phosphate-dependent enzyme